MRNKQRPMYLALILLAASALACNAPTPTTTALPPTVTAYVPATSPPQETPPTETLPPPSESPEATESATAEASPSATTQPSPAATAASTATPTPPPSEGPLDFDPPNWVHSWEALSNDQYRVVTIVHITGGAPPFTIEHDHVVTEDSPTQERDYNLVILTSGCGAIVHNITVKSADGQEASHDYYIGMDPQPWCDD